MRPLLLAAVLSAVFSQDTALARGIDTWSYEEMFAKSDFVVIARPMTATRNTSERTKFNAVKPPIPMIGVVTDFQSLYVLKGPKQSRFTLHHYREAPSVGIWIDGFMLAEFNPKKGRKAFLLFLVRERDGRFAPAAGQTDPLHVSIQELDGVTE